MIDKTEFFNKIWDVLVEHAGAYSGAHVRGLFVYLHTSQHVVEYRFGGKLGFGGKFWRNAGRFYVNAYPEDVKVSPWIQETIDKTNAALNALVEQHPEAKEWT